MRRFRHSLYLVVLLLWSTAQAQTNTPAAPRDETQRLAQSYQELLQQHQAALDLLDQVREEAEATAKHNDEVVAAKLKQLDDTLAAQRQRELESIQTAHRNNLWMIGLFAALCLAGMSVVMAVLFRVTNKPAHTPALQPVAAWPMAPGNQLVTMDPSQQINARFLGTMERLEKRLDEIETAMTGDQGVPAHPSAVPSVEPAKVLPFRSPVTVDTRAALLVGKGRALLNLQQTEEALACFDEAARLEPSNPETFIKKGVALEKLGRWNEAIQAYDAAIELNSSDTLAYLYKGGVLSHLEKFDAALACYEQALNAQNRSSAAASG